MSDTQDLRNAYPISTFKGRTQDELVEFITAHANTRINEVLDRLEKKLATIDNKPEVYEAIEAERQKLEEEA